MAATLYQVANSHTMQILDLNQVINALQQPSGGQETGSFCLQGSGYVDNSQVPMYVFSRSRNSTPVSVSLTVTPGSIGFKVTSPATNFLSSSGFQIFGDTSGAQGNAFASGTFKINY